MKLLCIFALLVFAGYTELFAQVDRDFFDSPEGYLGQAKPGDTPVVFAPGLVSKPERYAATIAFSPDGRKCIFYINSWPNSYAYYTEYKDKAWTEPVKAWFSEKYPVDEPVFSLDGKRIYYASTGGKPKADIWYLEWQGSTWSDPINMGPVINGPTDEFHPCPTASGNFYFTDSKGYPSVYRFVDGAYQPRKRLPIHITRKESMDDWSDAYVAPDESLIIFNATWPDGHGKPENYVSFRQADGTWGPPKNLGDTINFESGNYSADLSPDGKYLFFGAEGKLWWVKSDFLEKLR